VEAQQEVLRWFEGLGCLPAETTRARKFDVAGYVGMPFPRISREKTVRIGKYLSLWLLWDDVHVESLEARWRITAEQVLANTRPPGMSRFDDGWWDLFRQFAQKRSPRWLDALGNAMATWNDAAVDEAETVQRHRAHGTVPTFEHQLQLRIATIGMYATVYLLEDAYEFELPPDFHGHPTVLRMKVLANEIVGLGNDILSCGKDCAEGQLNLVTTLMHERGISAASALETLIQMHDEALQEYDLLATSIGSWSLEADPYIARWIQDVRYASLGFTLWEAQAPRYTAHKLVIGGEVVEPSFLFVPVLDASANDEDGEGEHTAWQRS